MQTRSFYTKIGLRSAWGAISHRIPVLEGPLGQRKRLNPESRVIASSVGSMAHWNISNAQTFGSIYYSLLIPFELTGTLETKKELFSKLIAHVVGKTTNGPNSTGAWSRLGAPMMKRHNLALARSGSSVGWRVK